MTDLDCAWASGFFDGEGCVTIVVVNGSWQIRLFVTQNDVRPLYKFQQMFGGRVDKPNGGGQSSVWMSTSGLAAEVAKLILPYSIYKKEQLDVIIDVWARFPALKGGRAIHAANRDERDLAMAIASVQLANMKKAFVRHEDVEEAYNE